MILSILLVTPFVQTYLGEKATNALNEKYGIQLSVEKVAITPFGSVKLKNILILDDHNDSLFHIKRMKTSILSASELFEKGNPYLGDVTLDHLSAKFIQYKGDNLSNLDKFIAAFDNGQPSSGLFKMAMKSVTLKNSHFLFINENLEMQKILDFKNLNGYVTDFKLDSQDLFTKIEQLSFEDHRGLVIKDLKGDFGYSKTKLSLNQLSVTTNNSLLKGNLNLLYKPGDFKDFLNKVVFDFDISDSKIAANDLNFLYNEFGVDNIFKFNTYFKGTLNDFTTTDLYLIDSNYSIIDGTINFKNLFDTKKSYVIDGDFNSISSSYNKLIAILPKVLGNVLPSSIKKFGNIAIQGKINLDNNNIKTNIDVQSGLGNVSTNITINDLQNIDNAKYNGHVFLNQFRLGQLLDIDDIGKVTLDVDVDGKGFTQKFLDTQIAGIIKGFEFNNYNYSNITIDGNLKLPYYKGYFNSNDKNLRMDFDGLIDLSSQVKNYNFKASIDYADLVALNFVDFDSVSVFKGKIDIVAKGNTIDDLDGIFNLTDINYQNSNDSYFFEDFQMISKFDENNVRSVSFYSDDIIEGNVTGKFKINQIYKIAQNAVGSLYTNYKPNKLQKNQYLDFNFIIHNKIIGVFAPEVIISDNTKIKGKIDADKEKFEFDLNTPHIDFFGNYFQNIKVDIDNKNPLYNTYVSMDSIQTKFYKVTDFNLINLTENDTLHVRTEFKGGQKNNDIYNLNLYHTIDKNSNSVIGFKKSEVNFQNFLWFINEQEDQNNKVVFDKDLKNFSFENFTVSNTNQKLDFEGVLKGKNYKDFKLKFDNVALEKITPSLDSLTWSGKVNGFVEYFQNNNIYKPVANLEIKQFNLNKIDLGDLNVAIEGDKKLNTFNVDAFLMSENEKRFGVIGNIENTPTDTFLDLDVNLNAFNLQPLEKLLSSVLSNLRGDAKGNINVRGTVNKPEINGRIYLNNTGMTIPYLNVDYQFEENAILDVTESQFIFRSIKLTDTKFNSSGIVKGYIEHNKMANWAVNLSLDSDYILALDTKETEENSYYGTAFMKGKATINGPIEALYINVNGESEKGTTIKIPIRDSEDVGQRSYFKFITKEEKYNIDIGKNEKKYNGIELKLYFDIDTDAEIEVILDTESGHAMKGKGYGTMFMEINTLGKFLMTGDFQVYQGEYNFKKAGLIDKKFKVKPGGTIRWEGEPFDALLNLEAVYYTESNPSVLIESSSFNSNRKIPTEVSILINGSISKIEPDFYINFPTVSSVMKSEIDYQLQNKDARQNQAFALLALGSFTTPENASSVAYGSLFEKASSLFNDLFSDSEGKLQVGVDYSQGDRFNQISDRVGLTLSTKINEKISINGKVGVPVGGVSESVLVGAVEVQFMLNEDGTLRARVFNRENDIIYIGDGIGYTQGVGLNYAVDFDTFRELIIKIFKDKRNQSSNPTDRVPDSDLPPDYMIFVNERKVKNEKLNKDEKETDKIPEVE